MAGENFKKYNSDGIWYAELHNILSDYIEVKTLEFSYDALVPSYLSFFMTRFYAMNSP